MLFRLKAIQGDTIAVPQIIFSKLGDTNDANFRVALYILATGTTSAEKIAEDLKLRSKQVAERALLFWAGAGLLEQYTDTLETPLPTKVKMTWQDIATASRNDPMIAGLVECAQTSFGRALSHNDMQKLVELYIQEGFHPETMMLCVTYLSTKNKRTVNALHHELKAWQNDGVVTGEQADKHLQLLALREKRELFVAELLQIPQTELTQGGRKAIVRWYENFGFDDVMLQEGVLHCGAKKDLWYLNSILKTWHSKGVLTVHDVRGNGANTTNESRNIRVDRQAPSENDFLQNSTNRPRRLKRKE